MGNIGAECAQRMFVSAAHLLSKLFVGLTYDPVAEPIEREKSSSPRQKSGRFASLHSVLAEQRSALGALTPPAREGDVDGGSCPRDLCRQVQPKQRP